MSDGSAPLSHALAVELLTASSGGAGALVEHSPLGFVIAFGAGIASFVSPCVLPLVPSYLSMMSGVGGLGLGRAGPDGAERARLLWSTLLFVAGFSLVFAVLEATASTLSHPLQAHKLVLSDVAGALIVAMGVRHCLPAALVAARAPFRSPAFPARAVGRPGHGHDLCLRMDPLHHPRPGRSAWPGLQRRHTCSR